MDVFRAVGGDRCGICDETIDAGEDVVLVDGELCHAGCAVADGYTEDDA